MDETCSDCGRIIGTDETPCVAGDRVVCGECHCRRRLTAAAANRESVRIVYAVGSQPGTARDVVPVGVVGESMRAVDANGIEKTYQLAHVTLAAGTPAPEYQLLDTWQSVEAAIAAARPELEALGWHVREDKYSIGVYRFWKNGKPKKTAVVRFDHSLSSPMVPEAPAGSVAITLDAGGAVRVEEGPPEQAATRRPFSVRSEGVPTRTFGAQRTGMAFFMQEARRHAPGNAPAAGPA